ncbi:MAG: transposase [Deltaproteobacteria bacterium]|jgi:hypothetical protein|nr:transposase [Deltaproteobacteria bacterium]
MLRNPPVPMPAKYKAIKKGANGVKYVYHVTKSYVLEGKRKYDCVCIGKMDEDTGMLIPNQEYYKFYPENTEKSSPDVFDNSIKRPEETGSDGQSIDENSIRHYGNFLALRHFSDESGLTELLEEVFPNDFESILDLAFFMASEGDAMSKLNIWRIGAFQNSKNYLDESVAESIFASITFEQKMKFFEKWTREHDGDGYTLYDVANMRNYSKYASIPKLGRPVKDPRKPQFNLAIYCERTSKLPLYYNLYQGGVNDEKDLEYLIEHTASLGLKGVTFVFDRGFRADKNLFLLYDFDFNFITPMSSASKIYKKLFHQNMKDVAGVVNCVKNLKIYGKTIRKQIAGIDVNIHIFFNANKINDDDGDIYDGVDYLKLGMKSLYDEKHISAKYSDTTFENKYINDKNISYEDDLDSINEMKFNNVYFIIITSDTSLSAKTVLKECRKRDAIEKSFSCSKNERGFGGFKARKNKTLEGKIFIRFLSFILVTCISNKIKTNAVSDRVKKLSAQDVLGYLKEYNLMKINGEIYKTTLSKIQNEILASLGLSV